MISYSGDIIPVTASVESFGGSRETKPGRIHRYVCWYGFTSVITSIL